MSVRYPCPTGIMTWVCIKSFLPQIFRASNHKICSANLTLTCSIYQAGPDIGQNPASFSLATQCHFVVGLVLNLGVTILIWLMQSNQVDLIKLNKKSFSSSVEIQIKNFDQVEQIKLFKWCWKNSIVCIDKSSCLEQANQIELIRSIKS